MLRVLQICESQFADYDTFLLTYNGIEGLTYTIKTVNGLPQFVLTSSDVVSQAANAIRTNGVAYMSDASFDFLKKLNQNGYNYADKVSGTPFRNAVWGGLPSDSMYKATVEKMIRENFMLFITGERNINQFDTFVSELNKAGLDQLTKEANDWYNRFNK